MSKNFPGAPRGWEHPDADQYVETMLLNAGFSDVTRYFGAFLIDGWVAFRKRSEQQ